LLPLKIKGGIERTGGVQWDSSDGKKKGKARRLSKKHNASKFFRDLLSLEKDGAEQLRGDEGTRRSSLGPIGPKPTFIVKEERGERVGRKGENRRNNFWKGRNRFG